MQRFRGLIPPLPGYLLACGANGFLFGLIWTMLAPYQIEVLGLSAVQLIWLGTFFEIAITLCEVPTGVVADTYSRRVSFSLGYIVIGLAFLVTGTVTEYWMLAAAAMVWGVGETLVSGAREAWIADELTATGSAVSPEDAFSRGSQVGLISRFFGTWFAYALTLISPTLPIVAGSVCFIVIGAVLLFGLTEKGFKRTEADHGWKGMTRTFKDGWRNMVQSRVLPLIITATFVFGIASEAFDRLWQKHLIDAFVIPPLFGDEKIWWPILNSAALVLAAVLTGVIRRTTDLSQGAKVARRMVQMSVALVGLLLVFGLASQFWVAAVAFVATRTIRRAIEPIEKAWINLHAVSENRATLLSLAGQAHSFGEILSGPLLGEIAKIAVKFSILVSAGLLMPTIGLLQLGRKREEAGIR